MWWFHLGTGWGAVAGLGAGRPASGHSIKSYPLTGEIMEHASPRMPAFPPTY